MSVGPRIHRPTITMQGKLMTASNGTVTSVDNAQGGIRREAKRALRNKLKSCRAALELPFRFTFGIPRVRLTQPNHHPCQKHPLSST